MSRSTSRAYKLKLSDKGIRLFLDNHCRICRLAGDLLSYGATLHSAMVLLANASDEDLVAEILRAEIPTFGGTQIRYVGTSQTLSDVMATLTARISETGVVHPAPQSWKLFIAGLCSMQSAEDRDIRRAYDNLMATMANVKA